MKSDKLLASPLKPVHLPASVQWLAGEGCGSWFYIERNKGDFVIKRYSPNGKVECAGNFIQETGEAFNEEDEYSFTFLSHCSRVCIMQNKQIKQFKLIKKL